MDRDIFPLRYLSRRDAHKLRAKSPELLLLVYVLPLDRRRVARKLVLARRIRVVELAAHLIAASSGLENEKQKKI